MRVRPDKDNANHRSVFDKVMTSISDNITVRVLTLRVRSAGARRARTRQVVRRSGVRA
jgi:hypothetical protein